VLFQDQILAIISAQPGISIADIREALPDVKRNSIVSAVARLRESGRIERVGVGAYRVARSDNPERKPDARDYIRPLLSRLMGRR